MVEGLVLSRNSDSFRTNNGFVEEDLKVCDWYNLGSEIPRSEIPRSKHKIKVTT